MLNTKSFERSLEKILMVLFLIVFALTLVSIKIQAQNGWTKVTTTPTPRFGASAEVVDNKIYVIGGFKDSQNSSANEMYDPLTNTWEQKKSMPTPRGLLATAVVNDTIYAIGGGYPTVLSTLEAYDPIRDQWVKKKDMISPRFELRAGVVNGIIYCIGAAYGNRKCEAYDPVLDEWTVKTDKPNFGGPQSVTVYYDLIYTFGGTSSPSGPAYSAVFTYNSITDTWERKNDMPTARFNFQTYLVKGKIYAIGGSQGQGKALSTVETYDPVDDQWIKLPDAPFKLTWFSAAVMNDKIYVIGGTPDWVNAKSEVWEYVSSADPISVKQELTTPGNFGLEQNYPNPFNPTTKISWQSPISSRQVLKIFDVLGNEVKTLVNKEMEVGYRSINFNASDLPSGVYFYQLKAGSFVETKKMILLR